MKKFLEYVAEKDILNFVVFYIIRGITVGEFEVHDCDIIRYDNIIEISDNTNMIIIPETSLVRRTETGWDFEIGEMKISLICDKHEHIKLDK